MHTSARDKVIQTPELLENILRLTDYQSLVTSVSRVNKYFNATVNTSPCLQKAMFESFKVTEPSDLTNPYLINEALGEIFHVPGTPVSFEFLRCRATCSARDHLLEIGVGHDRKYEADGNVVAASWRKLRVILPLDNRQSFRAWVYFFDDGNDVLEADYKDFPGNITLGELYDEI
jgi:hypothetical protein